VLRLDHGHTNDQCQKASSLRCFATLTAGYVVYKGDTYPGRHEPIVDQKLFDLVQEVLDARNARGQRDRVLQHYLKGALFCGRCHTKGRTARLIYTRARSHTGKRYGYFLCRARQEGLCDLPHLAAARVERAVVDHYATLHLPDDFVTEVRRELEEALADEEGSTRELHSSLNCRLKELDQKESRLVELAADDSLPVAKTEPNCTK
jgi:site-specific DNA recombinase